MSEKPLGTKVAVVTGASRGIGKGIALALAESGARVACIATSATNAEPTVSDIVAQGGEAIAIGCHVEQGEAVAHAFADIEQRLGPVDVLVNNAGISRPQPLLKMTEENWDAHMDINAKSVFLCSQAAIAQMKNVSNHGCVINIGSIAGIRGMSTPTYSYDVSKASIHMLTQKLGHDLALGAGGHAGGQAHAQVHAIVVWSDKLERGPDGRTGGWAGGWTDFEAPPQMRRRDRRLSFGPLSLIKKG